MLATIGYERAELGDFIATLAECKIDVLVDIRDRAQSRRPGFSKSALSAAVQAAGIEYIHMPELGDPKDGREAARRGDFSAFRAIFAEVLQKDAAKAALTALEEMASNCKICLMCYERDQLQCHRKIVSDHLAARVDMKPMHLGVRVGVGRKAEVGRMRDRHQSPATSVQSVF